MDYELYEGFKIHFQNDKKLVNLTDLSPKGYAPAGLLWRAWQQKEPDAGVIRAHRPVNLLALESTVKFRKSLGKKLKVEKSDPILTTMGRLGGTFAHWQIALAYAPSSISGPTRFSRSGSRRRQTWPWASSGPTTVPSRSM